jgi:radical SAM enzyme (TIGR01210 family)
MNSWKRILPDDELIVSSRGSKNKVDPFRPYLWLVEKELTSNGKAEDTAIVFLTNRECPYHCLMCDLWKNTTDATVPVGAIPEQIKRAMQNFSGVKHIKLYNSGSFFDVNAIPEIDYPAIADLLANFETVIVESHPKLINARTLSFKKMLKPRLEVALGLETVNREILRKLNKRMTPGDFCESVRFLKENDIGTRAFILLKPPFMNEEEGIYWAEKSIDFAFECGTECSTVIPVRGGNGIMEVLKGSGSFVPPLVKSLEKVLEYGIGLQKGRVFADTWDLNLFSDCRECSEKRVERITSMNLGQTILSPVICVCN